MSRHALVPIFGRQLGLATRSQALEVGIGVRQLHRLVTRGELIAVNEDVVRHPAAPVTLEQRQLAAVLAAGPGAALSHRSAAVAIGVSRLRTDLIEVTRPTRSVKRVDGVVVHRIDDLAPIDVQRIGAVDVTTPARTVIDLGLVAGPPVVRRVLEEWIAAKVVTFGELEAVLDRVGRRGRNGAGVLREILADSVLGSTADSVPEARFGEILRRHGLPALTHHHLVVVPSGMTFELDWSYPAVRLGFEIDGYGIHLRSTNVFEHDRWRHNELEIHGWRILHFAGRTVLREPRTVVDQVRRALRAAESAA